MTDDLVKLCKRLSKHAHAQLSSADLDRIANRIEELEDKLARAVSAFEQIEAELFSTTEAHGWELAERMKHQAEVARLRTLKDTLAGDKINLVSELRQVKAELQKQSTLMDMGFAEYERRLATARRDAWVEAANFYDSSADFMRDRAAAIRALAQEEPTT